MFTNIFLKFKQILRSNTRHHNLLQGVLSSFFFLNLSTHVYEYILCNPIKILNYVGF